MFLILCLRGFNFFVGVGGVVAYFHIFFLVGSGFSIRLFTFSARGVLFSHSFPFGVGFFLYK